jgi:hypothetical protein
VSLEVDSSLEIEDDLGSSANLRAFAGLAASGSQIPYFLSPGAMGLLPLNMLLASGPSFSPEDYADEKPSGELGDGTDDGPALQAMSAALNAAGGGVVDFYPGRTYWVGGQTPGIMGPPAFPTVMRHTPDYPYSIDINGCTKRVVVNPNGAIIKCLPGKKYGTFDAGGNPIAGQGAGADAATPYFTMLMIRNNSGDIIFTSPLDLDGNIANQEIGGGFGDVGNQFPMSGWHLKDNTGVIRLKVRSHHHGLDGGMGDGPGVDGEPEDVVIQVNHHNNGRNNYSHVGGVGWHIDSGSRFVDGGLDMGDHTYSAPGAGIDIEAEGGKFARDVTIGDILCSNNAQAGLLTTLESTNTYDVRCYGGTYIGTTGPAAYLPRPGIKMFGSTIVGQVVNPYPHAEKDKATQFHFCRFYAGLTRSPIGSLYAINGYFVDAGGMGSQNILFNECVFDTEGNTTFKLGYTNDAGAIYRDCEMIQDGAVTGYPRGQYYGTNKITTNGGGNVDLSLSTNWGRILLNGEDDQSLPQNIAPNLRVGTNPSDNVAEITVGPAALVGLSNAARLVLAAWNSNSSISFWKDGAQKAEIRCDYAGGGSGAMDFVAPDIPGGGYFRFFAPGFASQQAQIDSNGISTALGIRSTGGKIGYDTGAGGTVTQLTSKATGVTLNKSVGEITLHVADLAADTAVSFTLTNSQIAAGDRIIINHVSGGTFGAYHAQGRCAAGSAEISVRNLTAGLLGEAIVLGFTIIKGVTS